MIVFTAQDPRSGTKKAMTRCPPTVARIGSFGPTGPRLVVYSSAEAATLRAATPARAQNAARTLEQEMWTIDLASFTSCTESVRAALPRDYRCGATILCCSARQITAGENRMSDLKFRSRSNRRSHSARESNCAMRPGGDRKFQRL